MCPVFCSFGAMLFIVNLLIKADSTVICVSCTLEHVCYEPLSLKNCRFRRYPMLSLDSNSCFSLVKISELKWKSY